MQREQLAGPGTRLDPPPTHHAGANGAPPSAVGPMAPLLFLPHAHHTRTSKPTPTGSPSVQPARPPAFLLNPQASFPIPTTRACMAMAPQ
jgi:hypothetical protein